VATVKASLNGLTCRGQIWQGADFLFIMVQIHSSEQYYKINAIEFYFKGVIQSKKTFDMCYQTLSEPL
jgi:hypothetical protein